MNGKVVVPLTVGSTRASIPKTTQGSTLTTFTFQITDSNGAGKAIAGTLSASFEREGEGPYAIQGTLTPDADQMANPGVFTYKPVVDDVQYAGTWLLRFWETVSAENVYTFGGRWEIQANQSWSASVVEPPPVATSYILKVSPATAGHLVEQTADGSLTDGEAPQDGNSYARQNAGWTQIVGGGDIKSDGSVPMTGPLEFNPGADDSAISWFIPITSTDGADIRFNVHSTDFAGVDDTTWNLGFNNDFGGPITGTRHAWYIQMEDRFNDGGTDFAEWHLNLFPAGGSGVRPFEYKYRIDGTAGTITNKASTLQYVALDDSHIPLSFIIDTTSAASRMLTRSRIQMDIPSGLGDAFFVRSDLNSLVMMDFNTSANDATFASRILTFKDASGTETLKRDQVNRWYFGGETFNGALLNMLIPNNARGIYLRGAAVQSFPYLILVDNAATVQFQIGAAGQIQTNQTATNTNTPAGATAHQLPIYNGAGTLLGYIPVYGSAW